MKRALVVVTMLLAGCGGESADLFEVQRSGPGAVDLVVNDGGTATCDKGEAKALPGKSLLDARELARQLEKQATLSIELPKGPSAIRRYEVRTQAGRTSFWDTSPNAPKAFSELQVFTKKIVAEVC